MRYWHFVLVVLLLAACNSGERQRLQLEELERQNRADSLLLNDSLARDLADWFDRHGTSNEQMRAYYILGRTYADRGEVPAALDAYNTASDRADTTAADCDYAKLSRVHAQKAELFYYQLLPDKMIQEERQAMRYAETAKDTMQYLYCYGMLAEGYDMKNMPDSALIILQRVYNIYKNLCHNDLAAGLRCSMADIFINRDSIKQAKDALWEYETKTGFFDSKGDIEQGREIFYYYKGLLFVHTSQQDSAEYYFRKLLTKAESYDLKIAGFDGLQRCYEVFFNKDSLVKYSILSDSVSCIAHNEIELEKMLQTQAMYDFSRNERMAHQKKIEAEKLMNTLTITFATIIILLLLLVNIYIRHRNTKTVLENRIDVLRGYTVNERLQEASVTKRLKNYLKDNPYTTPTLEDWKELKQVIDHEIPSFYNKLNGGCVILNEFEYDVCLLIKIQIQSSDIAKFKHCVPSYITQTRKNIYRKIFGKQGRAEELDEYVMRLS